ncbi:type I-E CRISPR-associated protein Cas7/Cse4/CasC, partial [Dubosiella newyorkensis]
MKSQLFVDVHVLETVPPSCINRDDSGSPKTAIYGGKTRARVSSQAWKKAVRDTFKKMYSSEEIGFRTKKVVGLVQDQIKQLK